MILIHTTLSQPALTKYRRLTRRRTQSFVGLCPSMRSGTSRPCGTMEGCFVIGCKHDGLVKPAVHQNPSTIPLSLSRTQHGRDNKSQPRPIPGQFGRRHKSKPPDSESALAKTGDIVLDEPTRSSNGSSTMLQSTKSCEMPFQVLGVNEPSDRLIEHVAPFGRRTR